jgi:hypothetical protein
MVAAWRATCHGLRRASGVSMMPIRMELVASATAARLAHGSATGDCDASTSCRKNPSHPAASASDAIVASSRTSAYGPSTGTSSPNFMTSCFTRGTTGGLLDMRARSVTMVDGP